MSRKPFIGIALVLGVLLSGCTGDLLTDEPTDPPKDYANLVVTVAECDLLNDPYCDFPKPIPGATVYLYYSEEDRAYDDPVLAQKVTGGTGKVEFSQLEVSHIYFLKTISLYGTKLSVESTPFRGIAYHEVLYERP